MNERSEKPSCFVMGLGRLCIRCVEYLLDRGEIEVRGLLSADEAVVNFGKSRGLETLYLKNKVRYSVSKREIDELLTRSSFDYFFSIINAMFLPEELVQLPRKLAINFHDSELPKYAGIDATSWAIMRREPHHAVTWHVMIRGIDEGDIVKQVLVPIEARETAFTLNEKCLDVGFEAFKELQEDLARGTVTYQPQLAEHRSYYSRSKPHLPEMVIWNHGVVSWRQSASDIEALTRALDYGPSRNSLGTAKLFIEGELYILPSVAVCEGKSELAPGTVVSNDGNALVVATSSGDVSVREVLAIDGRPMTIAALSARHDLAAGAKLGDAPPDLLQAAKELDKEIMWKEAYWASAIRDYERIPSHVQISSGAGEGHAGAAGPTDGAVAVRLSARTRDGLRQLAADHGLELRTLLFGGFSSFLATLLRSDVVPIWYSDEEYRRDVIGLTKLFSPHALCRTKLDGAWTVLEHYRQIEQLLGAVKKQRCFPYDLLHRYPQLRTGRGLPPLRQFSFVSHGASGQRDELSVGADAFEISLEVMGDAGELALVLSCAREACESTAWLAEQLAAHLEGIVSNPGAPFASNERLVAGA